MYPSQTPSPDIRFRWGVRIPTRDGIHLNATVYLSRDARERRPCILALTPYVSDHLHDRGSYFATNGLPCVVVDVRGRGNSEGCFRPYIQEANDGYDVVEWLARQPFCDGRVAMYGGSYLGYCQWAVAKEGPAPLATIVPTAAPCLGVDVPMRNNIVYPFIAQWLMFTSGYTSQARAFADRAFWSAAFREWHESGRPFRELEGLTGGASSVLQEWLAHPEPDGYWDAHNPTAAEYAQLQIPILTITGIYDDDQPGALEHYRRHVREHSPEARRHYLVIGPWDHASTAAPQSEFGGVRFGPASLVDIPRLHLEWYRWTLNEGPRPQLLKKPVAYYVTGSEQWRHADTLEQATDRHVGYFLDSDHNPDGVFLAGALQATPGSGPPDQYQYDPRDARGPEVQAESAANGGSLIDQSVTLALRAKQLIYHSAPFDRDTEITGFFVLHAWLAIDHEDTDIYVSVHEIGLDGSSLRLTTDAMRARYREGLRTPRPITTRDPLRYEFERFTFVSRLVRRGHRLRLIIAPMGRIIEATFAQKNYCGGGVVSQESAADGGSVTVTLFHDASRPSVLYVPVGRDEAGTGC